MKYYNKGLNKISIFSICLFTFFTFACSFEFKVIGSGYYLDKEYLKTQRNIILKKIGSNANEGLPDIKIIFADKTKTYDEEYYKMLPEWGVAGAIGNLNTIIIKSNNLSPLGLSFNQTLVHELTHILLSQTQNEIFLPRWFNEGLAMTFAQEFSFEEYTVVARAVISNNLISLSDIGNVNKFYSARASLAYAQSHLAVLFLTSAYGDDVLVEIIKASRKNGDFWRGLKDVLFLSRTEFEDLLHKYMQKEFKFLFILNDTWLIWTIGAFLFILIIVIKKWQNKKKLNKWKKEEIEPEEYLG